MSLNASQSRDKTSETPEKLALAREAFREFHARCFWFMHPDAEINEEDIPYLCERLRADGGRRGFFIADRLCR